MRARVLGVGGSNHDFSATIVKDGVVEVAIEDERVQRIKQAQTDWQAHPARDATNYCLDATGIVLEDLVGIFCCDDLERPTDWLDWSDVTFVNHHAAHAAASFFSTPHEEAALLVVDGHGSVIRETAGTYEVETISIGRATGSELSIKTLECGVKKKTSSSWRYVAQNSIGWFYEVITMGLGFGESGQGKTMGLAAYGSPALLDALSSFVDVKPNGRFEFDPYGGIADWLSQTLGSREDSMQVRADIAYAAQEIFVDAIVQAAGEAYRQAPSPILCFGGGCALNTLANSRILEATPFEHVSVFPASGDNGLSIGAAFLGAHSLLGHPRCTSAPGWQGRAVYTGREYSTGEVEAAAMRAPVTTSTPSDLAAEAARALVEGETVAVFRGGSEIGPRALGHRSLLALPSSARMRDHINLNIKQRESFRPLAPVVPVDQADTYFEGIEESPYMLFVATVRDEFRHLMPAVTHIDGTARVQTVREEDNPFLYRLLNSVGELAGAPVLLNTSLNFRGMPIVESPEDALELFLQRPIDLLLLGDLVVRKYSPWAPPAFISGTAPVSSAAQQDLRRGEPAL